MTHHASVWPSRFTRSSILTYSLNIFPLVSQVLDIWGGGEMCQCGRLSTIKFDTPKNLIMKRVGGLKQNTSVLNSSNSDEFQSDDEAGIFQNEDQRNIQYEQKISKLFQIKILYACLLVLIYDNDLANDVR